MALNERQQRILNLLIYAPSGVSIWKMQLDTGYPQASIRRLISELRSLGWNIYHRKVNGFYYSRYIMTAK